MESWNNFWKTFRWTGIFLSCFTVFITTRIRLFPIIIITIISRSRWYGTAPSNIRSRTARRCARAPGISCSSTTSSRTRCAAQKSGRAIAVLGFLPDLVWNGASDTDFSYIESFFNSGEVFENHIPASRAYSDEIVSLIRQIGVERDRKEDGYKMMIKTKLMQILTILYRYHPKKKQSVNRRFLAKTQPVSQYIRENCTRPLSLCECAGFCSYSPAYFSKLFHEVWGMRFSDYLCRVRVETSAKLLRESTLSVKEVFERSGFQSFSAFSEAFKKHTGATPAAISQTIDKRFVRGYNLTEERFL